jgi:hypothetical protein
VYLNLLEGPEAEELAPVKLNLHSREELIFAPTGKGRTYGKIGA